MNQQKDRCFECEVFKNQQEKDFLLGFFCPLTNKYVTRNEYACEWIVSDEFPF